MNEAKVNSLLEALGLTEYEAKTLSALFKLKEAEAPHISRAAQVPKTRVYDVLDRLVKKNLIIEISGRPKVYRVVEPAKVFGELVGRKKAELDSLEKAASDVQDFISSANGFESDVGEKVMKVKDRVDFIRIASQEITSAKNSIFGFTSLAEEYAPVKEAIKVVSKKNVEIKLIGKIVGNETSAKDIAGKNVKLRNFDHGLHGYIIDGRRIILALSDLEQPRPEYHFTIWRDNKKMVSALGSYFDQCWGKGKAIG